MEQLTLWMFVFVVIMTPLAAIVVWSPRKLWVKILVLILSVGSLAPAYIVFGDLLSRPKPIAMEWMLRETEQVLILGAKIENDVAIYLWLQIPEVKEPRYYIFPWDKDLALKLQEAMREARRRGDGTVLFLLPFKKSLERRNFGIEHPFPQLAMPEKAPSPERPPLIQLPRNREPQNQVPRNPDPDQDS